MAVVSEYFNYDPSVMLQARAAVRASQQARMVRRSHGITRRTRWFEFQDLRFSRDRLWTALQATGHLPYSSPITVKSRERPVFSYISGAGGVPRMVERPWVRGGAGLDNVPTNLLACTLSKLNGAVCLAICGELDLASLPTFLGYLQRATESNENVVLNLKELRFIDSSGINALLSVQRRFGVAKRRIVVAAAPPMIERILRLVALDGVIPLYLSMDAAVASFAGRAKPGS